MATQNIGPKIQIEGYAEYDRQMKEIVAQTKALKAEEKELASQYKTGGSAADTYKQKQKNLTDQIAAQEKAVQANEEMLEKIKAEYGPTSVEAEKYRKKLAESKTALNNMKTALNELKTPLETFGENVKNAGEKLKNAGTHITNAGKKLTTYITAPLVGIGAASLTAASNFEQVMSKVQALGQMSDEDLARLSEMAKQLGATTAFTSAEVGEGFSYMALAGWDTEQMLSGIEAVLNLAAASGAELGVSSDIVTDALTAFGLSAEDAGHFVDVLAQTSANSNTDVVQMGEAFKYAAPLAGTFGYTVEDIGLALGLMANSGIKASQAGTTLRSMISKLASPTKAASAILDKWGISVMNADGTAKPFVEVMGDLRQQFQGLTADQQAAAASALVGKNAMSGFLALMNTGSTDVTKLSTAINKADGAAKTMANTMLNNTAGKITLAKSAIDNAAISLGTQLAPYAQTAAEKVSQLATDFANLDTKTQAAIVQFGLAAAAAGPLVVGLGSIVTAVGNVTTSAGNLITTMVAHPLATILAVTAVAAGWVILNNHIQQTKNTTSELTKAADDVKTALKNVNTQLATAKTNLGNNQAAAQGMSTRALELIAKLNALTSAEKLDNSQKAQMKAYVDELNKIYPDLNLEIDAHGTSLNKTTEELTAYVQEVKQMAMAEAYYDAMVEAYKAQAAAEAELTKAESALKKAEEESKKTEAERKLLQDQILGLTEDRTTAEKNLKLRLDQGVISQEQYNEAISAMNEGVVKVNGNTMSLSQAQTTLIQKEKLNTTQTKGLKEAVAEANKTVQDATTFAGEMAKAYESTTTQVKSTSGAAKDLGQNIASGMNSKETLSVIGKAREAMKSAMKITDAKPLGETAGKDLAQGVVNGTQNDVKLRYARSAGRILKSAAIPVNVKSAGETAGKDLAQGVVNGTQNETKLQYARSAANILKKADTPTDMKASGESAGKDMAQGVVNGTQNDSKLNDARKAASNLKSAGTPSGMYDEGYAVGNNMSAGFIKGVEDKLSEIRDAAATAAGTAINKMKNMFNSHSPSRVMIDLGHDVGEGFVIGITGEKKAVEGAIEDTFSPELYGLTGGSANINNSSYGDTVVNLNVTGAPGQDVRELADIIEQKIALNIRRREAAFA